MGLNLLPIQKVAVDQYLQTHRKILALPTGFGKTIVATYIIQQTIQHDSSSKILVITPANLRYNTGSTIEKFYPEIKYCYPIISSLNEDYETNSVLIISYNFMRMYFEKLVDKKFQLLIVDEFHYAKNISSSTFKDLARLTFQIPYFIGLTASPYSNTPQEFFALIYLVSKDHNVLRYWKKFVKYKTEKIKQPSGRIATRHYPIEVLYQTFFKKYFGKWIFWPSEERLKQVKGPKPILHLKKVNLTKQEYAAYLYSLQKIPAAMLMRFQQGTISDSELSKIRNWLIASEQVLLTPDALYKGLPNKRPGSKMKFAAELIKRTGEQTIVFSQFLEDGVVTANKYFNSIGIKSVEYSGNVKSDDRRQAEEDYNEGKIQVVCLTMAGMEGINLPTCKNVIFLSLHFNPEVLKQVQGRALRITSKNKYVNIYWLLSRYIQFSVVGIPITVKQTIDEWMANIVLKKKGFRNKLYKVLGEQSYIDIFGE